MNANGQERQVVFSPGVRVAQPSLHPSGDRIAFVQHGEGNSQIFVINRDGTGLTAITKSGDGTNVQPAWSPDGQHIAFISYNNGPGRLSVMDADGQNVRRLTTDTTTFDDHPDWSPDGQRIVFDNWSGSGPVHVQWISAFTADTTVHPVSPPTLNAIDPTWCSDGNTIVFSADNRKKLTSTNLTDGRTKTLTKGKNVSGADCGYRIKITLS